MNLIASFFLRARHWQIFLLLVGVGIVSSIWLVVAAATITPENFARITLLDAGLRCINMLFWLAWLWAMGSFLNSIVEPALRLGIGFFRFALIYPVFHGLSNHASTAFISVHAFCLQKTNKSNAG